jgi:mono/diheme cytochrome c family protein
MRKWILRGLAGLVALIAIGVVAFYGVSEAMIRHRPEVPLVQVRAASGPEAVARGEQLARLYGCGGCHEANLQGQEWEDSFWSGRIWTSNLTRAMPHYTDAQLARTIRAGVKADGSLMWGMPSESWVRVTDAEMADLLAYLRTFKPAGRDAPSTRFGALGRWNVLRRETTPTTAWVAEARANPSFDAGPAFMRGRHLADTVCSECHGSDLKGRPGDTPDLLMGASYDLPGFTRLMRTGVAADGKEKGLMTEVARSRFSHFTDRDIADLHGYLTARAERTP